MLVWSPDEVLACLEAVPEVEEYEASHTYIVSKDGIRLELTIRQYEGDVGIHVNRDGWFMPLFQMKLIDCPACRYVNDQRGEYLEFAPARCFGNRYDDNTPIPFGIRLSIKPNLSITLF